MKHKNNIQPYVDRLINYPDYFSQATEKLARKWETSPEVIYEAKLLAKDLLHSSQIQDLQQQLTEVEDSLFYFHDQAESRYIGSETTAEGIVKKYETDQPLSPEEIKQLAGVDDITTTLGMVWDKLGKNGKWTYSIQVKYLMRDFYSPAELKEKLKTLFPDTAPVQLPFITLASEKALVVLLSDEHAGCVNVQTLFDNQWDKSIYLQRLLKLSREIKSLGQVFEEVHVLCLGDQLNGWNAQTTRGGHEVKSLSNREQFDIYVQCRKVFYDDLFTSGVGQDYFVHDMENSNHAGKDFSYIANQYLDLYLELRYPQVTRRSCLLAIDGFDYGLHTIGFGHGKDETFQTRPMPLNLDHKTDLFLFQYFDKKNYSPTTRRISFYKGDLHSYNLNKGKFGRYVNIPSLMGSTDYSELNFGDTEAGAVLEILHKHSKMVEHLPVWF